MSTEESGARAPHPASIALGVTLALLVGLATTAVSTAGPESTLVATRAQADALAGHPADRCIHAGAAWHVCSWRMPGRLVASKAPIRDGAMTLVCDLPKDPDGGAGVCAAVTSEARPVRSDGLPHVGAAPIAGDPYRLANATLAAASSLLELSKLAGDVADACRVRGDHQECRWRIRSGTPGHERLSALVPLAETAGPIALDCLLPLDGSVRGPDTCRVTPAPRS